MRSNIVIAAILEGNSIALAAVDGTELMRVTDVMDYAQGTGSDWSENSKSAFPIEQDDKIVDIATMQQPG